MADPVRDPLTPEQRVVADRIAANVIDYMRSGEVDKPPVRWYWTRNRREEAQRLQWEGKGPVEIATILGCPVIRVNRLMRWSAQRA